MKRAGMIVGLALLAVVSGAIVARRVEQAQSIVLRTIKLGGTLLAVDGGTGNVFLAGGDHLRLLDGRTGAVLRLWTLHGSVTPGAEFLSPSVLALDERNRRLFVTAYDFSNGGTITGHVNVLDLRRQRLVPTAETRALPLAVAVDQQSGRAFVVTYKNNAGQSASGVMVLDGRTGKILQRILVGRGPTAVAVDERTGRVFVSSQRTDRSGAPLGPGTVSLLDGRNGRIAHSVDVPQYPFQIVVDARYRRVLVLSRANQSPYRGRVSVLDARTGAVLRTVSLPMSVWAVSVDDRAARAFVAAYPYNPPFHGSISVLNLHSGALPRTIRLNYVPAIVTVDAAHGHVFVAGEQPDANGNPTGPGRVSMLDARSGALLRTITVGGDPSAMAIDTRAGRVFVASVGRVDPMRQDLPLERGSISVLDARTGALLRTVSVGVAPRAIVVDEQTGRAFVLCDGGAITRQPPDPWAWLPRWLRRRLPFLAPPRLQTRVVPPSLTVLDATR